MRQLFGLLVLTLAIPAFAQETSIKIEDAKEKKPIADDVDSIITNKKMRAESGSKSLWSISTAFAYNGGTVQSPLAAERPNIADSTGTTDFALLDGSVSIKRNLSTQDSLNLGVGVRYIAPLEGQRPKGYEGDRFDASNPYVTYQHLYAWRGLESSFTVQPSVYTNSDLVREGYQFGLLINQDSVYEFGHSGLTLGFSIWGSGTTFNKSGSLGNPNEETYVPDLKAQQSDYQFGLDPFLEYEINDTLNLRTVTAMWAFEHRRSDAGNTYRQSKMYQSLGLGISVTRDIFLYPNVQFLPENIRSDRTNVALNSNINIF